jgi:hypothetical protein
MVINTTSLSQIVTKMRRDAAIRYQNGNNGLNFAGLCKKSGAASCTAFPSKRVISRWKLHIL